MVQLHGISSINDDIGTLSNWRIATLFKFFERLGKIKATASNDEVRYSRKGPDANRGKAKTIKLKRLIFRRLI